MEKYGEEIDSWPECTKACGIVMEAPELHLKKRKRQLQNAERHYEMPLPPNINERKKKADRLFEEEEIAAEESDETRDDEMIEDGYVVVAADGACPNQATKRQLQRAGCGLYYGKKHPWNFKEKIYGSAQGAQRGELQAAKVWAAWAFGKTKLLTDSQYVY